VAKSQKKSRRAAIFLIGVASALADIELSAVRVLNSAEYDPALTPADEAQILHYLALP
jgi:hypothetical protein